MSAAANCKIVFTGPVGAGKTTAIAALSDTPPIRTDEAASDVTAMRKPTTTVALDYGILHLPGDQRVHLYGTPGQKRFDFMWDILTEGGIGLVLLLDGCRPEPHADMRFFLDAFSGFIGATGVAIGVTRLDLVDAPERVLQELHAQLRAAGLCAPLFTVDARDRRDVRTLVKALLFSLDPGLSGAA